MKTDLGTAIKWYDETHLFFIFQHLYIKNVLSYELELPNTFIISWNYPFNGVSAYTFKRFKTYNPFITSQYRFLFKGP
jgi:hypothetical protein